MHGVVVWMGEVGDIVRKYIEADGAAHGGEVGVQCIPYIDDFLLNSSPNGVVSTAVH